VRTLPGRAPAGAGFAEATPANSAQPASDGFPPSFLGLDPPEHDRLRRMTMRHFGPPHSPQRVDSLMPKVYELSAGLVDRFSDQGGVVDLVDDFAYPLPVAVICELLGVPPDDEPRFRHWVEVLVDTLDGLSSSTRTAARDEAARYIEGLIDAHRRAPGDDLLSAMVTDPDPLPDDQLVSTALTLLVAGHETTVNLIANGMLTFLREPRLLDRLRAEPSLVIPAVEELLRYDPPVQFLPWRSTLDDVEVAGVTIPKGSPVTLLLASGSRDPAHVPDPDRFDPSRPGLEHLGFGGGVHYCFGAPLARIETQIALLELARRMVRPRLVLDPPPYRPSPILRGPRHLVVEVEEVLPRTRMTAAVG